MSDTAENTEATDLGAEAEATEQIQVAPEALARWAEMDPQTQLKLNLTKADLDHLLLGLRALAIGQSQMVTALTGHINQDMDACARALLAADKLCVASYNRINAFITMLMLGATPEGTDGPAAPQG